MNDCAKREWELLEQLAFVRVSGSPEELQAANILADQAKKLCEAVAIEQFEVEDSECMTATLEVTQPYSKSYTVTAYRCCADTDDSGLDAEFVYVDNATDASLADARGKIVLLNGYLRLPTYQRLVKAGVAGFVTMSGTLLDKDDETDLFTRKLRAQLRTVGGSLPAVNLRASDGFELVTKGAARARLTVKSTPRTLTSHNVIAEIKGSKYPEQIISFGAHYDSVEFSTGVYDNGAGSVILVELLRHFAANPPLRTVKLCWYGSEEVGLEGSRAFVRDHAEELSRHLFMINVDVAGPVLGYDVAKLTGENSAVHFTDAFMKIKGYPVEVTQSTYSSDSIPFADKGIPAVNFCRDGAEGASFIHCRNDVLGYLSGDALAKTTQHVLDYSDTIVNAVVFPFERTMPTEMVEAVDKYLYKKELEKAADCKQ